jgi:hypothetical protein
MLQVLAESGLEVLADHIPAEALVEDVRRLSPDAIVLGLGGLTTSDLRERVRAAAPRAKVILWSRDETQMQVFDPGSPTPRRVDDPDAHALVSELRARQASRGRR